jgi:arginine:pyruvate transaminase
LLDVEKLSVLPGSVFGAGTTWHIRLSLVQPEDVLSEGCNRLERFLNALT